MAPGQAPEQPLLASEAGADAGAAGIIVGLVIGLLLGFVIGFVLGARAKQLLQAVALTKTAFKTIIKSLAPEPAGAAEEAANEEEVPDADVDNIDDFINNDNVPGLDDHPDLEFSPVFMYKVKVAKEEARREKRRQQLLTEGYDPDQMDDADAQDMSGPVGRVNPLQTLIDAGARVTPLMASQSNEAAQREDRRRQIRTLEAYMQKNLELDTSRASVAQKKTAATSQGKKYLSALDAARLTSVKRAGTDADNRTFQAVTYAKAGRNQLRDILQTKAKMFDELPFEAEIIRRKALSVTGSGEDVAAQLQAELNSGLLDDEGEEGEEGEEGQVDGEQLEA